MFKEFIESTAGHAVIGVLIAVLAIVIIDLNYRWFFKTALDFIFALLFFIICSPLFAVCSIISAVKSDAVFEKVPTLGKGGKIVFLHYFKGIKGGLKNLPALLDIMALRLSFVGVKVLPLSDGAVMDDDAMERCTAKPGVVCHLALNGYENLTYEEMFSLDKRYNKKKELFTDIFTVIKSWVYIVRGERGSYLGESRDMSYSAVLAERGEISEQDIINAQKVAEEAVAETLKRRV